MTVLFADGNYKNRIWNQIRLKDGIACEQVKNGDEAVRKVRRRIEDRKPYDLIFLDEGLSVGNGRTTLESIRNIEAENGILLGDEAVIVMTSAEQNKEKALVAFCNGCDYYLHLPVETKMLNSIIKTTQNDLDLKDRC